MKILFILGLFLLMPSLGYSSGPTPKICQIMKDALSGDFSPKELCDQYDGRFCYSMKLMGQAVCAAHEESFCSSYKSDGEALCEAVDGSFCSSVDTLAGGYCSILGESFCSSATDERKWKKKLANACRW